MIGGCGSVVMIGRFGCSECGYVVIVGRCDWS